MEQFEYVGFEVNGLDEGVEKANELGKEGWELVNFANQANTGTRSFVLKRKKRGPFTF